MDAYITGNTIRKLREAKKLTQVQLAEKLDVSDKAVSTNGKPEKVCRISRCLSLLQRHWGSA